jgi:hypothetical protein
VVQEAQDSMVLVEEAVMHHMGVVAAVVVLELLQVLAEMVDPEC